MTNTIKTVTEAQLSTIKQAITATRTDSDTRKAMKFLNLDAVQVLANHGYDLNTFQSIVTQSNAGVYTIAQKSLKRAVMMLYGIANKKFTIEYVPFEITTSLINYAVFEGRVSGQLASSFITRLIELSDESQIKAGGKLKLYNRGTKGVKTASAQASSIKGMLRALGTLETKKFSREAIADINNPLFVTALDIIKTTLNPKNPLKELNPAKATAKA